MFWLLRRSGEVEGPFASDQLKSMWSRGETTAAASVRETNGDQWVNVMRRRDIFSAGTSGDAAPPSNSPKETTAAGFVFGLLVWGAMAWAFPAFAPYIVALLILALVGAKAANGDASKPTGSEVKEAIESKASPAPTPAERWLYACLLLVSLAVAIGTWTWVFLELFR